MFLGVLFIAGGILWIFAPIIKSLSLDRIINIILGITLVILGASFIWSATKDLRKNKEKNKE